MSDTRTDRSATMGELMTERIGLVQEIARLNSAQLRNRQIYGGCDFEALQCEREIEVDGGTASALQRLEAARERLTEAQMALSACDEELSSLHERLSGLDRKIAGR